MDGHERFAAFDSHGAIDNLFLPLQAETGMKQGKLVPLRNEEAAICSAEHTDLLCTFQ